MLPHIISLGAGVQSSTMALMAAKGEIEPMPEFAVFADTGDEPIGVYTWLDWLKGQLPFSVYVAEHRLHGKLSEQELRTFTSKRSGNVYRKSAIPAYIKKRKGGIGMLPRKCTGDFKILPLQRTIKSKLNIPRGCKELKVVQWIGISVDEAHRMKPSDKSWSQHRWPLVELKMAREDCLIWMIDNKYPTPPRSACIFCPYHSDAEWNRMKQHDPKSFWDSVEFERRLQISDSHSQVGHGMPFLHRSCLPLNEVKFTEEEKTGFGNECVGMCGV